MTDQLSGGLELRPARPEEFDACRATLERWYGLPVYDEDREVELATFEPERSLGVFDGGEPVATAGIYGLDLTVPGGPLPVAGVTWISVLPMYRRRGLLTAMLSRQLRELHEGAGEPVAALFASEPGIYGRFGYGLAAFGYAVTVPGGANGFVAWAPAADGRLRLAGPGEALAELRSAYDGVWRDRVGYYARTAGRWQARLHDPEYDRHGAAPLACVLHESDGGVDGYALYSTKGDWDREVPSGIVSVREVLAATPSCAAALWRFLLDHDLMGG